MKPGGFLVVAATVLAITTGAARSPIAAAPQRQTTVVTSTADSGPGTLREALERASPGTIITFDPAIFAPDNPATIFILSALPELTQGEVTIDGSDRGVILDGSQAPLTQPAPGLMVTSPGNVIQGLQILRFSGGGIILERGAQDNTVGGDRTKGTGPSGQGNVISGNVENGVSIHGVGTSGNVVSGNYIGTDVSGSFAVPNRTGVGITDGAAENIVGGSGEGEGNVISGNEVDGVIIAGATTTGNKVIGNLIGISASGTEPIGNGAGGVWLGHGTQHNVIGGANPGERNIISGNGENGLVIDGSSHNTISGNFIGTDVSGSQRLGNANIGVVLAWGAQHNLVGGTTPEERNLISGNGNVGVSIADPNTNWNTISGNYVGTDVTGTRALANAELGVHLNNGASYNVVGGTSPGEGNLISGNGASGVRIDSSDTMGNSITGNLIGTDLNGREALSNASQGVLVASGATLNVIGPANTIAYNGEGGVAVLGDQTLGNTITANSIHQNEGPAILDAQGGNAELPAPTIIYAGTRTIRGTAPPGSTVEVFSDEGGEGRVFEGATEVDQEGSFAFRTPQGRLTGPHVTVTCIDAVGNTSEFSSPGSPPETHLTRELPHIVAPTQVSVEPKVVGTNLSLALFCVAFFGLTSSIFNSILKDYRDELVRTSGRVVPQAARDAISRIGSSLVGLAKRGRGRLPLMWLSLLLLTSLIESFLDPEVGVFSAQRVGLLITLFVSAMAVSGLESGSDLLAHRRWAPTASAESRVQWVGIAIALACVILSRALDFKPGYLYGIVGAVYLVPKLAGIHSCGKRAALVLLTVLSGGFVLWIATAFLPAFLAELEPLFLTIFLVSLQGVFFALIPLAFTDGGDIWTWRRSVWLAFFAVVLFCFYHFVLNPNASDVRAVQQNGVQTLLALVALFGIATLLLWLLFPFRLGRQKTAL